MRGGPGREAARGQRRPGASAASPERITVPVAEAVSLSALSWNPGGPLSPVLLVHGLASNARLWDGVAGHLAGMGHAVAAVDQRGHGLSTKADDGYDFETLTADLDALVDRLGWRDRPPVAAGQSWGAKVVLELAARHPESSRAIVLVDGGTSDLSSRFADWPTCEAALAPPALEGLEAGRFEALLRSHHPDWPEAGIAGTLANVEVLEDGTVRPWLSRRNHMRILRRMWEHHPGDTYPSVTVPVGLVMAEDRTNARWMAGKRAEVARAEKLLARWETYWIEGDHDLHAQYPAEVGDIIHDMAGST